MTENLARITDPAIALSFVTAGKSTFTVRSLKTGAHLTFKVKKSKKPTGPSHFVTARDDADGFGSFSYLGVLWNGADFNHGVRSLLPHDGVYANTARWLFDHLKRNELPAKVEFWHEGRCGRCGRPLTDPTSISSGLGPECRSKMGL